MKQIDLVFTTNQNKIKSSLAHLGNPMWYWECPVVRCGPTFIPGSFLSVLVTSVVRYSNN